MSTGQFAEVCQGFKEWLQLLRKRVTPWDFSIGQACRQWLKRIILDFTRDPPELDSEDSKRAVELKKGIAEIKSAIRGASPSALEVFISHSHYLINREKPTYIFSKKTS